MPTSNEDICNLALGYLGEHFITDIFRESNVERLCRLHLPQVRRCLLRMHAWNFAIMRVKLPASLLENTFGFEYRYALPSDYLQTLTVWQDSDMLMRIDKFKVEGEAILTDHEEAWLEYVADITCTDIWTVDFIECVSVQLAARLAIPLGAGIAKSTQLMQQLEQICLPRALTNNSWEDFSGENNPIEEMMRESPYIQKNNVYIT